MTNAPRENFPFDPEVAVEALLGARMSGVALDALPPRGHPTTPADAYAVQDMVARRIGPVVGWKVGAPSPVATPARAPIHAQSLFEGISELREDRFRVVGIEAEIAFRFARDLPTGGPRWSRENILDAVASVHPVFEICDTRFAAFGARDPLSHLADQGNHGALVVGPAAADWRSLDFAREHVTLDIDDERKFEAIGGNSAGDPIRLLVWLANEGAAAFGGLRAGQTVTTGSCTGTIFMHGGQRASARFAHLGGLELAIV